MVIVMSTQQQQQQEQQEQQQAFTYTRNIKEEIQIIEQKHALRCKKDTNDIGYVLEIRHNLWSSISRRARRMAPHFSEMA